MSPLILAREIYIDGLAVYVFVEIEDVDLSGTLLAVEGGFGADVSYGVQASVFDKGAGGVYAVGQKGSVGRDIDVGSGETEEPAPLVADYHGPREPEGPAHQAHCQFNVALCEGLSDSGAADGEVGVLDYVLADYFVTVVLSQLCEGLEVSLPVLAGGRKSWPQMRTFIFRPSESRWTNSLALSWETSRVKFMATVWSMPNEPMALSRVLRSMR